MEKEKYAGKTAEELVKLLEERDTMIEKLESIIYIMKDEQNNMVDQFKSSTNVLIERLKTEAEQRTGVRPQTAQLLYGDKKSMRMSNASKLSTISENSERKEEPKYPCFNCNKKFPESKLKRHMVECYRSVVKCKICAEYMLKSEVGEHLKPFKDLTIIKDAAMSGDQTKLKSCIDHGFQVDTPFPELYNFTLAHLAIETQNDGLLRFLSSQKASAESKDIDGNTPLNLAVLQKSETRAVNILDLLGTTAVNIQNNKGEFPLYLSIKHKLDKLAKTLLAAGADPNLKTKDGDDCVSLAQTSGQLDLVTELIKRGAKLRPVSASSNSGSRFRQLKGF